MLRNNREWTALSVAIAATLCLAPITCAAVTYRMVAATGIQAPGAPPGATFAPTFDYDTVQIDATGHVAFRGDLKIGGGGVTKNDDSGLWWEGSGTLAPLAREGDPAPGTPNGTLFNEFASSVELNTTGQVAFWARLRNGTGDVTTTNDQGIWTGDANGLAVIARTGSQPPQEPAGYKFANFGLPMIDASGHVLVEGTAASPSSNHYGLWSTRSGPLSRIAYDGEQMPGAPNGVVIDQIYDDGLVMNSAGKLAFAVKLASRDGGDTSENMSILTDISGSLALVAQTGDPAPGAPAGKTFSGFAGPVFGDSGRIAFVGILGQYPYQSKGVWYQDSGPLTLSALQGNQAPGVPDGAKFGIMAYEVGDLRANPAGQIAFTANLQPGSGGVDDTNYSGIWSDRSGDLDLIVRQGSHAPGTEPGATFDRFSNVATINAAGRISFTASLSGTDPADHDSLGLWAEDQSGNLSLIVRAGQVFHIAANDDRIVSQIWPAATLSGLPVSFNENFTLAFILDFTDGSQAIYTASLLSLPGDYDHNGVVDAADYVIWRKTIGQSGNALAADANNNGHVDSDDFDIWRANYGATTGADSGATFSSIPEPASLLMMLLGAAATLALRIRKDSDDPT